MTKNYLLFLNSSDWRYLSSTISNQGFLTIPITLFAEADFTALMKLFIALNSFLSSFHLVKRGVGKLMLIGFTIEQYKADASRVQYLTALATGHQFQEASPFIML